MKLRIFLKKSSGNKNRSIVEKSCFQEHISQRFFLACHKNFEFMDRSLPLSSKRQSETSLQSESSFAAVSSSMQGSSENIRLVDTVPNGNKFCRVCWETSTLENPLIVPCQCTNNERYVHRNCLDRARIDVDHPSNLYRCPKCHADFHLIAKQGESSTQRRRRAKFHLLVLRDFFFVFLLMQFCIILCALLVKLIDNAVAYCVPACQPEETVSNGTCIVCAPLKATFFSKSMEDHERITYYSCGFILFLAFIGLFGICNFCFSCIEHPQPVPIYNHRTSYVRQTKGYEDCCCCCDAC